jgi:nucleoside-diphosphate-sugar epimerase
MLIAVTGATGFVGRYIANHLGAAGHRLRCWHRPQSDRAGIAANVEWQLAELGDAATAEALVRGVDAVVHAAVDWDGPRQRRREREQKGDMRAFLEHNLMGSLELFQAAYAAGVPRFVYISSCAVHEVILEMRPLDESHPLWPTSHYGAHKAAVEAFVHSYGFGFGWPICALRPTGVYGVAQPAPKSRWFDLVGRVLRNEPIDSASGGKEVHAADVARAVELLLHADASKITGQAFNCYDRYIAEESVANLAKELSGSSSTIAPRNRGPKHQIVTDKLRRLGMAFGGEAQLRQTVAELIRAHATA